MSFSELRVPKSAYDGVVTIGNFDGVHRGHQAMLSVVAEMARAAERPCVAVTFDPHPGSVLRPDISLARLSTISVRTELLRQFGADHVVVLPVTLALLQMSPDLFFRDIVQGQLHAAGMVEGPDFRFGRNRAGDTNMLGRLCVSAGIDFQVICAETADGEMISSTGIRRLITDGQLAKATQLLGHRYSLQGKVGHGAGRGRQLNFPTANLEDVDVLIPGCAVYAAACQLAGQWYPVAVHIGHNPTFDDALQKIECHVIGFDGDLYGTDLRVEFIRELRDLKKFSSAETLTEQIQKDVADCVHAFRAALA